MTNRTEHTARATAPIRRGRQVALAASMALVGVTGTATIAWSALSLALGPGLSAGAPPTAAPEPVPQVQTADTRGFADATRDLAAAPPPAPVEQDVVVLSTRSIDTQRLGNAVQPKLFGGSTTPTPTSPVARPVAATGMTEAPEETRMLRPVARPVVAAPPVVVAAVAPEAQPPAASQPRTAAARDEDRLRAMWSVGLFR